MSNRYLTIIYREPSEERVRELISAEDARVLSWGDMRDERDSFRAQRDELLSSLKALLSDCKGIQRVCAEGRERDGSGGDAERERPALVGREVEPLKVVERMTPEEFKAEYRRKGWTGRDLAERWHKSVTWISKIGSDPERDLHWDDAVRGLPDLRS